MCANYCFLADCFYQDMTWQVWIHCPLEILDAPIPCLGRRYKRCTAFRYFLFQKQAGGGGILAS